MAMFDDFTNWQLICALHYTRSRLAAVLKHRATLTTRVEIADVRNERHEREYRVLEQDNETHRKAFLDNDKQYKDLLALYNDLKAKHHVIVEGMQGHHSEKVNKLNQTIDDLTAENEELTKKCQRIDGLLAKTRAAFTQLKQRNAEKTADLNRAIEVGKDFERRLYDAWATAKAYGAELTDLKVRYEQLNEYVGYVL